jgi:type IV pilus biogenesis protein CpaD/CtpE
MKQILTAFSLVTLLATAAAGTGCATDTPRVDASLGKSVAAMVQAQTYDPNATANPPALAPEVGDGQRLKNVIDGYRKTVATGTAEVTRPIAFEAGK